MKRIHLITAAVAVMAIIVLAMAVGGRAGSNPDQQETELAARVAEQDLKLADKDRALKDAAQRETNLRTRIRELEAGTGSSQQTADLTERGEAQDPDLPSPLEGLRSLKEFSGSNADGKFRILSFRTPKTEEDARHDVPELLASGQMWKQHQALRLIEKFKLSEFTQDVVDQFLDSGEGHMVERAAAALGAIGDPRTLRPLRDAYAGGDLSVKRATALAMRDLGDGSAVVNFVNQASYQMLSHSDGAQRLQAARQLRRLKDTSAVPSLRRALQDSNSSVRAEAALGIGEVGDRSSLSALAVAKQDPVESVRKAAERASDWIEDPSTKPSGVNEYMHATWVADMTLEPGAATIEVITETVDDK